ncbi:MAG TPA: TlpA disulfide reductase family protein [Myxococcales bacterium]
MALLLAALLAAAAPPLQLADAHGNRHRLADYRGKVVLVNFWATWCEPCKAELPSIERLRTALAGKPFVVLAVEMDGSARTSGDTAEELKLHFPMLIDRDSTATSAWLVNLLPTTFLVTPGGSVAFSHVGEVDWSSPQWRGKIEALLPGRPGGKQKARTQAHAPR